MADAARAASRAGERVAVLFGPERAGLENDDVARANAIVTVPVNPEFPSLNLAQCVLLMAYEWRRRRRGAGRARSSWPAPTGATAIEVEKLAEHYEDAAGGRRASSFPPDKARGMKLNLRNLWSPDAADPGRRADAARHDAADGPLEGAARSDLDAAGRRAASVRATGTEDAA